jgi:hypothetical protein
MPLRYSAQTRQDLVFSQAEVRDVLPIEREEPDGGAVLSPAGNKPSFSRPSIKGSAVA